MALSRKRILRAAFLHADKQGVEAVSMRAIAGALGVEAMSLYHHVPNKSAILDGLADLIVQAAELPTGEVTAQEWVRGAARGMRSLAHDHPRLIPVLVTRALPLADPAAAAPFEAGLLAFQRSGYPLSEAYAAVQSVTLALLALAQLEATSVLQQDLDTDVSQLENLPEEQFPLLREVTTLPAGLDEFWDTLVEALVIGLRKPPLRKA